LQTTPFEFEFEFDCEDEVEDVCELRLLFILWQTPFTIENPDEHWH
jgi:hypothetical protein